VDLGAGTGGEARLFSRIVGPSGRVLSVEAHPRMFRCLRHTVELNALHNVTPVHAAVVGKRGPVYIQDLPDYLSNSITDSPHNALPVPGEPLGELLDRFDVDKIDLLTLNIEGAELAVLEAARDVLPRVRNLVVSCHDFKAD